MPVLSPFQTLPLHIAESITHCYSNGLRFPNSYENEIVNEKMKEICDVLYNISRQWRAISLRYSYGTLSRRVNIMFGAVHGYLKFENSDHKTDSTNLCHVQKLTLTIRGTLVHFREEHLQPLSEIWPEDDVLPSAFSLTFYLLLTSPPSERHNATTFCQLISWVISRIKATMPNLRYVKINFDNTCIFKLSPQSLLSEESIVAAFLSAFHMSRGQFMPIPSGKLLVRDAPQLTTLFFFCSSGTDLYNHIVKGCASTLEEIIIKKLQCRLARLFFTHKDGQPVIFPRLKKLVIDALISEEDERLVTNKSITPFPALQYIVLNSRYIFADDTIFRGNGDTLKYLFIDIDHESLEILQQFQVFSDGKHPHLRYVRAARNHVSCMELSEESFLKFALDMLAPETYWLSIPNQIPKNALVSIIPTSPYAENIQVLNLRRTKLELLEMLNLIRLLPNMTDLMCRFAGIDLEPDKGQTKTLPYYLYPTHYPLSRSLKYWATWCSNSVPQDKLAAASMTLAVLCPKFTFTALLEMNLSEYHNELKEALLSGLYDKHAEKIQRLFCYD